MGTLDAGETVQVNLQQNVNSDKGKNGSYQMSDEQFDLWAGLLRDRTGMILPVERKSFLVTSVGLRMREIGVNSYEEYHQVLNSGANGELEWKYLIDRLTVHETRFFRHNASLKLVEQFIAAKPADPKSGKVTVQVWSVGCSTGEEAYTLAFTIDQALKKLDQNGNYFGIMATDISLPSIKTARKGIYNERRLKGVDTFTRDEYFEKLNNGKYQVVEGLRKRICFTPMNIMDSAVRTIGKVDIIYCQNLLIYFEKEKRLQIVDTLAEHLNSGGVLILGSGELLGWGHPAMKKLDFKDTLVFQRKEPGTA